MFWYHAAMPSSSVLSSARVRKPKDKPKAEGHVLIVERWILMALRHVKIASLGEAQTRVTTLTYQLNTRPFQKLPGCRRELWDSVERATLQPLPAEPYIAEMHEARVGPDYHVHGDYSAYSVPYHLVGHNDPRALNGEHRGMFCGPSAGRHPPPRRTARHLVDAP